MLVMSAQPRRRVPLALEYTLRSERAFMDQEHLMASVSQVQVVEVGALMGRENRWEASVGCQSNL